MTPTTVRQRLAPGASALALAARHEAQDLLGGARDQREHHDRERERARQPICRVAVDKARDETAMITGAS
jgi:hypothetical protein